MALSKEQTKVIKAYPLNDSLNRFPTKLRDLKASDESWRSVIASLLLAILDSTTAFNLPAPNGNGNVASILFAIVQKSRTSTPLQFAQFRPLVDAVITNSPDTDIWAAIFNLIADAKLSTPPPPPSNITPTFTGTPVKASSNRLANSETREIVEQDLFEEMKNCIFRNVGGFWNKFFKSWNKEQDEMLKGILTAYNGKRWTDFPTIPNEKPVWDWLCSLEEDFLKNAPYKLHTTTTANQFKERK
ncbi:hypothetical protein K445DRAFT_20590, partial [Daldinia sp. EC12]